MTEMLHVAGQPPVRPSRLVFDQIDKLRHRLLPKRVFQSHHYLRHNQRRLEHLASLGLDLGGKRVLELGAGVGDMTGFFLDRGCSVVSVEPRADCVAQFLGNLHAYGYKEPNVTVVRADVYDFPRHVPGRFDIVFAYGLLYHLEDPETAILNMAAATDGILLLETCVSRGDAPAVNLVAELTHVQSESIEGVGCRPTRSFVWDALRRHFDFVYTTRAQPAHPEFPGDWDDSTFDKRFTRAVFVASRTPLDNPALVAALPRRQETPPRPAAAYGDAMAMTQ